MVAGSLTARQEAFVAAFIGDAKGVAMEAARIAGYRTPHVDGTRVLANARVRERVDAYLAELKRKGIAAKENRLKRYAAIDERLWSIVEARAADPEHAKAPGGDSGFVARTFKMAANGDTVEEYHVDTGHVSAIENNLKQMAQELGEWDAEDKTVGDGLVRRYIGVNVQVVVGADPHG